MFERILFPTDFSVFANAVFACLPELRSAGVREVVLVHVIATADVPLPETLDRESMVWVKMRAEEEMHIQRMALEGQGLRVHTRIEYGNVVNCIIDVAVEERVGMIVIGAQGKSLSASLLLGSVANEVLRRSPVPVLIEKFRVIREMGHVACEKVCASIFQHVLYATDFSPCAAEAFNLVKRLKQAGTARVTLLHVQDERAMKHRPADQLAAFDAEDRQRLQQLERALVMFGLQPELLLRWGHPVKEILSTAQMQNASLIVISSRGYTQLQEMLLGTVAENVVRASTLPVLVIRCQES